ncbi:MAG: IS66 family transposase [Treponema sp.]|nr:IS66 family transposase [Treponema sp.]
MKREVTTQEALTELAAAKMKLESMQQLLVLKEQLLSSKDEQINFQIFTIKEKEKVINQKENEIQQLKTENENQQLKILSLEERLSTQINYRFGTHSEKSFEQLSLFDDLDDDFPEAEMLTSEELKEVLEENTLAVKAYKRRKCGRKKIADNLERVPIYHDIKWMTEIKPTVPESLKFGKALDYAIKAWPHLINFFLQSLNWPQTQLTGQIQNGLNFFLGISN